jgi:hypothetical protein
MKWKERKQAICAKCADAQVCGHYLNSEKRECDYLCNIMEGWKLGQADTLDAVESYVDRGNSTFTEEFMTGLKETLEE